MSRDSYSHSGRGGERWDSERFEFERDRNRFGNETRERFEERDSKFFRGDGRIREQSVDQIYDRRGSRQFEDDRYEKRVYYDDELQYERQPGRQRRQSVTFEKEREIYSPSPPRRQPARPGFLRRQSSLDTFDRRPLKRFSEREEYGPPARYRENVMPPPLTPIPLPRTRALPPPRRYAERDYEEFRVSEPDHFGDDDFRGVPERVREREIIRRRRRSRSRESRGTSRVSHSVRSSSSSSASSTSEVVRNEFPKKGKTRMPARLVSKKAIIDLGYPYEEEGDVIIIQKALGRENIDEVIKLSEEYKSSEKVKEETTTTTYVVGPEDEVNGRDHRHNHDHDHDHGTVIEETRTHEVLSAPTPAPLPPPPPGWYPAPPPPQNVEFVRDTTVVERRSPSPHHHHHHHPSHPVIVDAGRPAYAPYEQSDPIPIGPLALVTPAHRHPSRDERSIREEIRALELEKDALRLQRHAEKRRSGRHSETDLVLYEQDSYDRRGEEVTIVRREKIAEPDNGVKIVKDRKGRMSINVPKYVR